MMDMDEEEKEAILERVSSLGSNMLHKARKHQRGRAKEKLGVCGTCTHLYYHKTRLMGEMFFCDRNRKYPLRLNECDPIEECNKYWKADWADIWDLKEMAWLINPKRKVGF